MQNLTALIPIAFVLFAVFAAVGIRVAMGVLDHGRIREYIESRGGEVLRCHWAPFGRGWFGNRSDRIYEVQYIDHRGREHQATCKTSLFGGVYWTEDHAVGYGQEPEEGLSLEEENRRLREEVAWLRRQLRDR